MPTPPVSLDELARYPRMTGWFSPPLLVRLVGRVLVSGLFGHYADRRLVIAALDTAPEAELIARARAFLPEPGARSRARSSRTTRARSGSTTSPISATASTPPTPSLPCWRRSG
jgi:hypothetical protein